MPSDPISLHFPDDNIQITPVKSAKSPMEHQVNTKEVLKPHGKKNEYVSRTEMNELKNHCKNPKIYAKTLHKHNIDC